LDEKPPKHIAFSEKAVANGIPIKVSQKRYTLPPPVDIIEKPSSVGFRVIKNPCPPIGFLIRQRNALLISSSAYNIN